MYVYEYICERNLITDKSGKKEEVRYISCHFKVSKRKQIKPAFIRGNVENKSTPFVSKAPLEQDIHIQTKLVAIHIIYSR